MNYIFGSLFKNLVPYGILRDYAMEFTNLENYNGTAPLADSNYANDKSFWEVYKTLIMGRISDNASGFVSPDILDDEWYGYRQPGRITMAGLYFKYSRFKDNAANTSLIINNGRLYDKFSGNNWINPYTEEQAFVISPSVTEYEGRDFELLLPSSLWLTNSVGSINNIHFQNCMFFLITHLYS